MRSTSWLWRAAAWDGILPVAVALVPIALRTLFPPPNPIVPFAAVFLPIFAAMIRASIGVRQIARVCGGAAPVSRQLGLAAAIVMLLLFELSVGVLATTDGEPAEFWWFPVTMLSLYLITISFALRPLGGEMTGADIALDPEGAAN